MQRKLKNAPRHLQNLPLRYMLDAGDKRALAKYRNAIATKRRLRSKINALQLTQTTV